MISSIIINYYYYYYYLYLNFFLSFFFNSVDKISNLLSSFQLNNHTCSNTFTNMNRPSCTFIAYLEIRQVEWLLPSPLASLLRAADAFRVTWSEDRSSRIRHGNALTEKAWEDAIQGQGENDCTTCKIPSKKKGRSISYNEMKKKWPL